MSEINGNFKSDTNHYDKKITGKLTITTIIKIISFIVISIGTTIALFGWIFGYLEVTSIIDEGGTMKFVTAIFFILSGFTLYSLCNFIVRKSSIFYVAIFASSFIEFIFLMTLFSSIIIGIPTGIENAFSHEAYSQYNIPGKPSYPTIINFFFIVLVSFFALYDNKILRKYLYFSGSIIIIVSSIALIGYIINNPLLFYTIPSINSAMAFPTAILFTLIGSGMILLSHIRSSIIQKNILKSSSYTKLALITKEKDSSKKEKEDQKKPELNTPFIEFSSDFSKIKTLKLKHILIIFFLVFSIFPIVYVQLLNYNNIVSVVKDQQVELLLYRNFVNSIIIVTISTIISAIIFALILSKSISFPLDTLKAIVHNITQQQYNIPIKIPWQANLLYEIFDLFLQTDKMRTQIKSVNENLNSSIKKKTNELQIANQELLLHDKIQKDFINVAAHELRTPIMPILGLSQLLYEKVLNKNLKQEIFKESLQIIVRNSSRLHKLIESLLDVIRIESDKLRLNKERFDIYKLVNDTINDFVNKFENTEKNIFKVVYSDDNNDGGKDGIIFVYADRDRIQEVISNLLNNAYKFTENGQIIVTIKKKIDYENKQVKIIVKDTGTGIDKEILPRLFEKFATKSEAGPGLGLYISKKIVEAHGGKIWAENNSSDDRGATFYFTLPIDKS
ncbi:MAG TPA: HAMP domain-containing sensor histidine kinase [Nitrososphaeraceae archaeon]|nr:HAMP domain-containing sensor histidine kinase [Nitrososphaeraceae archaeon]